MRGRQIPTHPACEHRLLHVASAAAFPFPSRRRCNNNHALNNSFTICLCNCLFVQLLGKVRVRRHVRMHPRMDTHAHLTVLDINAHFYLLIQGCRCHQSGPKLHSAADSCVSFIVTTVTSRFSVMMFPPGPSPLPRDNLRPKPKPNPNPVTKIRNIPTLGKRSLYVKQKLVLDLTMSQRQEHNKHTHASNESFVNYRRSDADSRRSTVT